MDFHPICCSWEELPYVNALQRGQVSEKPCVSQRLRQKNQVDSLTIPQGYSQGLSLSLMYLKHLVLSSLKKKGGTVIPLECQDVSVYSKACTPTSSPFRPLSYNHALINTVNLSLYACRNTGTHMHLWQNEGWYEKVTLFKFVITGFFGNQKSMGFLSFIPSFPPLPILPSSCSTCIFSLLVTTRHSSSRISHFSKDS